MRVDLQLYDEYVLPICRPMFGTTINPTSFWGVKFTISLHAHLKMTLLMVEKTYILPSFKWCVVYNAFSKKMIAASIVFCEFFMLCLQLNLISAKHFCSMSGNHIFKISNIKFNRNMLVSFTWNELQMACHISIIF